jgi:hypothetical protein
MIVNVLAGLFSALIIGVCFVVYQVMQSKNEHFKFELTAEDEKLLRFHPKNRQEGLKLVEALRQTPRHKRD